MKMHQGGGVSDHHYAPETVHCGKEGRPHTGSQHKNSRGKLIRSGLGSRNKLKHSLVWTSASCRAAWCMPKTCANSNGVLICESFLSWPMMVLNRRILTCWAQLYLLFRLSRRSTIARSLPVLSLPSLVSRVSSLRVDNLMQHWGGCHSAIFKVVHWESGTMMRAPLTNKRTAHSTRLFVTASRSG